MIIPSRNVLERLLWAVLVLIATAVPGLAEDVRFEVYRDSMGFSCEFPSDWLVRQAPNTDRIFTSARVPNTAIIIQVIDRAITKETTAKAQLEAMKPNFLQARDGRILSEDLAPIAGQQAPYLMAAYTAPDAKGAERPYRHIQMAVTAPTVFLLMSYSAPDDEFDAELRVFQNCSATLQIDVAKPPTPSANEPPKVADAPGPVPGSEDAIVWSHNRDRAFWMAVPSIWSSTIDQAEPYSADMQHPERVEGVVIWVVDMDAKSSVKDYADAWEEVLAKEVFFMTERLAVPAAEHPGVGLAKTPGLLREYQGEMNGATVRSVAAYVVNGKRGFTIVGYHFLGDQTGEKRIRAAVDSFRLAPPEG